MSRKSFDTQTSNLGNLTTQSSVPWFRAGQILIANLSTTDQGVILLDTLQHTFRHFQNSRAATIFVTAGSTTDHNASAHFTDISITMDSIGLGPTIRGHRTLHYRLVMHYIMLRKMDLTQVDTTRSIDSTDYYITPDIIGPVLTSIQRSVWASAPSVDSAVSAVVQKLPHGCPLHIEKRLVSTMSSVLTGPITQFYSVDVDKISHGSVDTALFTIPPSYVQVSDSATHP